MLLLKSNQSVLGIKWSIREISRDSKELLLSCSGSARPLVPSSRQRR